MADCKKDAQTTVIMRKEHYYYCYYWSPLGRAHPSKAPCFVGAGNQIKRMVILDRPNQFLRFNWKMWLTNKS